MQDQKRSDYPLRANQGTNGNQGIEDHVMSPPIRAQGKNLEYRNPLMGVQESNQVNKLPPMEAQNRSNVKKNPSVRAEEKNDAYKNGMEEKEEFQDEDFVDIDVNKRGCK